MAEEKAFLSVSDDAGANVGEFAGYRALMHWLADKDTIAKFSKRELKVTKAGKPFITVRVDAQ